MTLTGMYQSTVDWFSTPKTARTWPPASRTTSSMAMSLRRDSVTAPPWKTSSGFTGRRSSGWMTGLPPWIRQLAMSANTLGAETNSFPNLSLSPIPASLHAALERSGLAFPPIPTSPMSKRGARRWGNAFQRTEGARRRIRQPKTRCAKGGTRRQRPGNRRQPPAPPAIPILHGRPSGRERTRLGTRRRTGFSVPVLGAAEATAPVMHLSIPATQGRRPPAPAATQHSRIVAFLKLALHAVQHLLALG